MRFTQRSLQSWMRRSAASVPTFGPLLFVRELMVNPAAVGAVWPSSALLARYMAGFVPPSGTGLVVELGAGTGAVTQALLDRGVTADRLIVIERSPVFVAHLRKRFPHVKVVCGDAALLGTLLPTDPSIDAIVSSMPLRSLPRQDAEAVVGQWRDVLTPGALVVQFTYALRGSLRHLTRGFIPRASRIAWANFPPARVVALESL